MVAEGRITFVLQRKRGRGVSLTQVRSEILRIGRGTNAELRSDNPAVALEHAVIESDPSGYIITDRGSITGTYVDGRAVESARLVRGNLIEIGDLRLEVQVADPGKPLFLTVSTAAAGVGGAAVEELREEGDEAAAPVAAGAGRVLRARRIDFADAYRLERPYLTRLSVVALLLVVALTVLGEIVKPEHQRLFMPGGVSSAHGRAKDAKGETIAFRCSACHDPWKGISDVQCTKCHDKIEHALIQKDPPPCADCHSEHRGSAKLAAIGDARCLYCHGDLARHVRSGTQPRIDLQIATFGPQHPEFHRLADADTLRFNHKLHLQAKGVLNGRGVREVLACTNCHRLAENRGKWDPVAIDFSEHCQRCHRLTFDARFPNDEIPHGGEPGMAYGFILATYSGNRDLASRSPQELRRIFTTQRQTLPDERAQLNAEQVIKVKCALCHTMTRTGGKLAAVAPVIRTRWLEHAKFSHTDHRNRECESCHEAARSSSLTSDVLVPSRKYCVDCHGAVAGSALGKGGRAASSCMTCHEYHERSKTIVPRPLREPATAKGTASR